MRRDPVIVIRARSGPGRAGLLEEAIQHLHPVAVVERLEEAVRVFRASEDDVALVVFGPGLERPLTVGRELRRATGSVAIAYVADPEDAARLTLQLGMVADLRPVEVVEADGSPDDLADELRRVASAAARRRATGKAIDALNRELLGGPRRELERAATDRVSASYLAAIVRHVPEAIVSLDHDHCVVTFNEAAAELLQLPPDQSLDDALQDTLDRSPELRTMVEAALEGATSGSEEIEFDVDGGDRVVLAVTAAAVRDHTDTVIGAVLVARDITVQRRSEERLRQLQKAQSLATLAGGVAHDFNNLLVSVRSWAQMAAEDPDDRDLVETALAQIERSADRAAELARSMLVYGGRGEFELEPTDVTDVVRQMADLLQGSIGPKVDLRLELDEDLPPVEAAPTQLRQVFLNLITNASEAIGDAPGTITVRARHLDDRAAHDHLSPSVGGRVVVVEVADTGPGMDRDTLERVFEPFFTTKFEGRGLGLAASLGIVRAHGGTLTATSQPGRGATFRVALPVPTQGGRAS